jgi:hypothetical protein
MAAHRDGKYDLITSLVFLLLAVLPLLLGSCQQSPNIVSPGPVTDIGPRPDHGRLQDGASPLDASSPRLDGPQVATGPCQGYTLMAAPAPNASWDQQVTLVDMEGNVVHQWSIFGMPAIMLPGGVLLGSGEQHPDSGVLVQDAVEVLQVDWFSKRQWVFTGWDADGGETIMARQHHDLQREGNPVGYYAPGQDFNLTGKTLILAHKTRLVTAVSNKKLTDDVIYEVGWGGKLTGFEWFAADHVDQMGFDHEARKAVYKDPRFSKVRGTGDWLHTNAMSTLGRNRWYEKDGDRRFHPDNILISSRDANFIAIIERATGNIVWRVGPDMGPGTIYSKLGQFVGQHHAHMIPHGLPGAGNILVFDNGSASGYGGSSGYPKYTRQYSRVLEFNPVTLEKVWQYGEATGPTAFFSYFISSAQRLPNGNTLINSGADGVMFEVTPAKKTVWRYVSKSTNAWGRNFVYRAYRVPPEWLPEGVDPGQYTPWHVAYPANSAR